MKQIDYKGSPVNKQDIDMQIYVKRSDPFPDELIKKQPDIVLIVKYID